MRPATWSEFNPNQIDHLTKLAEGLRLTLKRQRETNEGLLAALEAVMPLVESASRCLCAEPEVTRRPCSYCRVVQARAALAAAEVKP